MATQETSEASEPNHPIARGSRVWVRTCEGHCTRRSRVLASPAERCRARPPAALGIAPQSAERARGHTLAAMWLWSAERLAFLDGALVALTGGATCSTT